MLKVTLGEKTYTVDYVSALALREIQKPLDILARAEKQDEKQAETPDFARDLDILVRWFCLMFGNQFEPDDVYTLYPADRIVGDIALAVLAVKNRVSAALKAFPTRPAAEDRKNQAAEA